MRTKRLDGAITLAALGAAFSGVLSACGDSSEESGGAGGAAAGRGGGAGTRGSLGRGGAGGAAASAGRGGTSTGGAAGSAGSGGTSTGGTAGSAGKAGSSTGGAAGQDASSGACPATAPDDGSSCMDRGQVCTYGQLRCFCGGGGNPDWNCSSGDGGGTVGDAGGTCPPSEPADNSPCSSPGLQCDYGQNQCGCFGGGWRC